MNDFKNAHKQGVTTIEDIYEAPADKTAIVLELDVANVTNMIVTASVTVIDSSDSNASTYLIKNAPIPTGSALQVVSGQKIILEALDKIQVTASGTVDIVAAVLEDV